MSENTTPSIYTQPGGDADDVLGHRQLDKRDAADFTAADKRDKVIYATDEDDVEGHRQSFDKHAAGADFRGALGDAPGLRLTDDEDDVEGHKR